MTQYQQEKLMEAASLCNTLSLSLSRGGSGARPGTCPTLARALNACYSCRLVRHLPAPGLALASSSLAPWPAGLSPVRRVPVPPAFRPPDPRTRGRRAVPVRARPSCGHGAAVRARLPAAKRGTAMPQARAWAPAVERLMAWALKGCSRCGVSSTGSWAAWAWASPSAWPCSTCASPLGPSGSSVRCAAAAPSACAPPSGFGQCRRLHGERPV